MERVNDVKVVDIEGMAERADKDDVKFAKIVGYEELIDWKIIC